MLVKDLIKILKKHNPNNRVVFYNLENHNLTEYDLESIIVDPGSNAVAVEVFVASTAA